MTVRGTATVRAEPDEAMLAVTLTALKDDPGSALADVARRSEALVALLDELGIPPADRSTTGVSVREEFDHTPTGRRSLGHRAASAVTARVAQVDTIGSLVTRATSQLDARVDGPRWQIAHDNPVRLQAARDAAADAVRRARAYAEGVGARLGELVAMSEPDSPVMFRRAGLQPLAAAAAGDGMPIEAGEQEVGAAIDVTFRLDLAGR